MRQVTGLALTMWLAAVAVGCGTAAVSTGTDSSSDAAVPNDVTTPDTTADDALGDITAADAGETAEDADAFVPDVDAAADNGTVDAEPNADAGTGDVDAEAEVDAVPPVSVAVACAAFGVANCERQFTCSPYGAGLFYADEAACKLEVAAACEVTLGLPDVLTPPSEILACASMLSGQSCDAYYGTTIVGTCGLSGGKRQLGAVCAEGAQCASRHCGGSVPWNAQAPDFCAVCIPVVQAGESCAEAVECASGSECTDDVCVPISPTNGPCDATHVCPATNFCVSGHCATALKAGAVCNPDSDGCDILGGLYCEPTKGVCESMVLAKAGEPCGFDDKTYALILCGGGATCVEVDPVAGTFVCMATVGEGAKCDTQAGPDCNSGFQCMGSCIKEDPLLCK